MEKNKEKITIKMNLATRFMYKFLYYSRDFKSTNIKDWEYLFQQCIEESLTKKEKKSKPCWWQHTSVQIFERLLATKDVDIVFNEILEDLYKKEGE